MVEPEVERFVVSLNPRLSVRYRQIRFYDPGCAYHAIAKKLLVGDVESLGILIEGNRLVDASGRQLWPRT